jgi:hypothetical protein
MLDKNQRSLKSVIWIEFKHFDLKNGKLIRHSDELMLLFDKISMRGINTGSFDARVRELNGIQKA